MFVSNKSLKNQLICKYIIASPGNQVKKKISDFPWVIDLLSPVKKMCVIWPQKTPDTY